ncbi:MAG: nucleotide exchange factor GrpE [Clostridiales bacterium]|nr:nucleotide exchange factor GrpE [Clostridiales bacterium]
MKRSKRYEEEPQETPEVQEEQQTEETPAEEAQPAEETIDVKALEEKAAKADEYLAMAQRVQADFDNFRRRNESVRADSFQDGQRQVATAFLAVLDNLERALAAAGTSENDALRVGVEMTLKQMQEAYQRLGVTVIDRLGEKFDPNIENAVMQGSPEEGEPGTVCAVLQKGYMMGNAVIRYAMVKVVPD